jgi:uncharacterized membrane-anchored protein
VIRLGPTSWAGLGVVASLQTAVLGWIIYDRVSLLRLGREIVVDVVPLDPRDLFRGDYVIFGYPFSQSGDVPVPDAIRRGDRVYVTLMPKDGGSWQIVKAEETYPAHVQPENVVLKGVASHVWRKDGTGARMASLRYGIESYFVPEGKGRVLEELVRDKKLAAVIAIGRDGEAAIKALVIDGKRVVEEPLI